MRPPQEDLSSQSSDPPVSGEDFTAAVQLAASTPEAATPEQFLAAFDLADVPASPGCYLMSDKRHHIIYVGKAKNLRARLRAYINESDSRHTVKFIMARVTRIEFLVTGTEKEALLLENSLIKKHRPRYNFRLKDDKTYVSLRVNVRNDFPRVTVTRTCKRDGAKYFGPYASAAGVRETLRQIQRVFPLRTCSDGVLKNRVRPCLYYQMKQCCAPCVGYVGRDAYRDIVNQVLMVLAGRSDELERTLVREIEAQAEKLAFEKAAELRDRLYAVRQMLERQRTVRAGRHDDRDVFGVHTEGRLSEIQVLFFRAGKMTGGRAFSFNNRETPMAEVLSSFLLQYYGEGANVPGEILLPESLEESETLAEILSEARAAKVTVACPERGDKRKLVELAARNARSSFEKKRLGEQADRDLIAVLREKLKLSRLPQRIECFDISTIQGGTAVGSMVTFEGGAPDKSRYRRFSVRHVEGQDDFAMMREVLMRRYTRAIEESDLPDLVLVDGGKGQMNVAATVLKDLGLDDLDLAAIAKSRHLDTGNRSPERFFIPGVKDALILPQHSPVVLLLARIRDEAHRFAITYHRKRRAKAALTTSLLDIPGVGPARAKTLLTELGSIARIREAPVEAIAVLPGFSTQLAETIRRHLTRAGGKPPEGDA
jgi:excinuclease ABC subunit C